MSGIGTLSQLFPPQSKFTEADVPDLSGKVVIVTGGNTGIGREIVRVALQRGATVYLAARSQEKAEATISELLSVTKKAADKLRFLHLDLENVKSAQAAAAEFIGKETQLHILWNNAGILMPGGMGLRTTDGVDLSWGTNALGPFAFTEALLPILVKTAETCPAASVRIVTVSSLQHEKAPPEGIDFEGLVNGTVEGWDAYAQSKLANLLMASYWGDKLKDRAIVSVSVHPGSIRSELLRSASKILELWVNYFFLYPAPMGALTPMYAGTSPELTLADSGAYFAPWARRMTSPHPKAYDLEFRAKVIELLEKQVTEYA